ncbi:RNA-guided endonuclease InsQ/TnpB family protein [Methanolobus halotolerans]|uniref:Transposase n=1 Tax=Methanolobus halotolerans TaxID=2052935 RepID=A0A4E0PWY5_9EURY|nr:RNA-guided endonuclease TnpB family protein [Methanolobus halotolerans]TGC10625.1 transposase [Methanolobus halotolerans]
MFLTKTVILKIANPDNDLVETMQKYSDGMNYTSKVLFDNGKPMGAMKLQKLVYPYLRENLELKSQMSCNIPRQVAGCYKTLKKNKAKWQRVEFSPTSMTFSYKRDFTIDRDTVKITTINGRKPYSILNYDYAAQYFDGSWEYQASKVVLHNDGEYYFHLSIEKEIPDKEITDASTFMGVDVGINYLAVTSTTDKKCKFFAGGEIKNLRNHYKSMRARLQSKGTLSAKRMLKYISGKEKRLMRDVNHKISKEIVKFALENDISVIGLEDLTGIRNTTVSKVSKKNRHTHSSWAYRQLQTFIEYKARGVGILTHYVDPAFTSQTCIRCNHISKNNRNRLNFRCKKCGYENNADLNGAMNIEHKTRDFRYILESQGYLSATQTNA